jgi:drug/metabolite transporter (DMT)-like permease
MRPPPRSSFTLEGATTALMAWFIFYENFDRRIAVGMASLVAGAAVLSWSGVPSFDSIVGPLAIAGACVAWGLDNNLNPHVPDMHHTHRHY